MKKILTTPRNYFFLILIIFALYVIFYHLGKPALENWDEAWYAEVTKQMMIRKEFIISYWNDSYFIDKPPMYMWVSALFSSVLGLSELSVRLPSAISGLIIILLVLFYAYKNYGLVPSFVAFTTLLLNNIFIARVRSGNIDVFVTLLILLSYFLIISKNKKRYIYLGVLFGCIFLTKASLVIFPLVCFILHEGIFRRNEIKKSWEKYVILLAIFLSLVGGWLLLGSYKVGLQFINYYLFNSDQGVTNVGFSTANTDYIMYTYYSLQRRFFYLLLLGGVLQLVKIKKPEYFLQFLFGLLLLLLLSFTERKNNWYLIPSIPFWSLIIAYAVYQIITLFKNAKIVMLGIIIVTAFLSYRTFSINIAPILDTFSTFNEKQSSLYLKTHTKSTDSIVRLDHLYPAAVYYSDRHIVASPIDNSKTNRNWITRDNLMRSVEKKKLRYLVGKSEDVKTFLENVKIGTYKLIPINAEETVITIL